MEMNKADMGEFIATFLMHLANNLDEADIESVTPDQLREHATLIRLKELERQFYEPDGI